MTRPNGGLAITFPWGDRERSFRLRIGEWRKIEAKCNAGPEEIVARLAPSAQALENELSLVSALNMGLVGRWRVDDVREVILQGLLAGDDKMGPVECARLMRDYFDERPIRENVLLAFAIASSSIAGLPGDKPSRPDKPAGEESGDPNGLSGSPTDGSPGGSSTGAAAAPASRRGRSTK